MSGDFRGPRLSLCATSSPRRVLRGAGQVWKVVFKTGEEFEELAQNQLDDTFDASPIVVDGALYLRGWDWLYCIAEDDV